MGADFTTKLFSTKSLVNVGYDINLILWSFVKSPLNNSVYLASFMPPNISSSLFIFSPFLSIIILPESRDKISVTQDNNCSLLKLFNPGNLLGSLTKSAPFTISISPSFTFPSGPLSIFLTLYVLLLNDFLVVIIFTSCGPSSGILTNVIDPTFSDPGGNIPDDKASRPAGGIP